VDKTIAHEIRGSDFSHALVSTFKSMRTNNAVAAADADPKPAMVLKEDDEQNVCENDGAPPPPSLKRRLEEHRAVRR
jgi:hypothetical protein